MNGDFFGFLSPEGIHWALKNPIWMCRPTGAGEKFELGALENLK